MLYLLFLVMPFGMLLLSHWRSAAIFLTSDTYSIICCPTATCGYNVTDQLQEPKDLITFLVYKASDGYR